MPKGLVWKLVFVVIALLAAFWVSYPLHTKVVRVEEVTEKFEFGGWVKDGEPKVIEQSLLDYLMTARETKTTVEKEYEKDGVKYRVKRVTHLVPGKIKLGLDLRGGAELLYRIRVKPEDDRPGLARDEISILEKRIDPQGVLEYRIQQQGRDRILIQVPGATEAEIERLKKRIVTMGKLEFRLCTNDPAMINVARNNQKVPGYYKQWVGLHKGERPDPNKPEPRWYLVENTVRLTGKYLADARPTFQNMQPVVGFRMNQRGARIFARLTDRHIGAPLAILLDDKLVSAPTIRDRISGSGIISGSFTQAEVNDLVATLRAGSLPADLELEMGSSVGPSLGSDSIRQGITAVVVGSLFVLVFVAAYYLWVGCVADFALVLNLVLVIAALALFSATLTLPGIAGLVLTVGMAIDANVLIFERIREEKDSGKIIKLAIRNGYERAFTTILDANLTTLITAIVLYVVGTGPVKGFAVTLSCGIVLSMFTALYVTRAIFDFGLAKGWVTEMRMRRLFARPSIQFLKHRRTAFTVSGACIFVGLFTFFCRGSANYDIDFTGGTLVQLRLAAGVDAGHVRAKLKQIGYRDAEVQSMWNPGEAKAQTVRDFGIRIKGLSEQQVRGKITTDLTKAFQDGQAIESLNFTAKGKAELKLQQPAAETDVRKRLAKAGYQEADVPTMLARDVKAQRYDIWWGGLGQETDAAPGQKQTQKQNARMKLLAFIWEYAAVRDVKLNFADEIKTPQLSLDQRQRGAPECQLELDLSHPMDVRLLRKEVAKVNTNVRIHARSAESERDAGRRYTLSGRRGDLEAVKKSMPKSLRAPAAIFRENQVLRVSLRQPMDEGTLINTVLKKSPFPDEIRRVVPLGVKTQQFDLVFADLRGEKIQEKIRTDLSKAFADKLPKVKISVSFEPVIAAKPKPAKPAATKTASAKPDAQTKPATTKTAAAKTDAKAATATAAAQVPQLKVVFGQQLPLDRIRSVLKQAGCADALVGDYSPGNYLEVRVKAAALASPEAQAKVAAALETTDPFRRVVSIGGAVAGEMKDKAILALIFAMFAIVLYIWMRFGELRFGIAAVVALMHDVLFAVGAVAIAGWLGGTPVGQLLAVGDVKINLPLVAAFLTIVGYSLNDTIVIFDRIRENLRGHSRHVTVEILDNSINQTLSRTLLTSLTTFGVVLALYVLGGSVIHGFAYVLMVGVVVGTYSSMYIASPVLLHRPKSKKSSSTN